MNAPTLRDRTVPRFALRRDEVAAALGISVSTFNTWVDEGKMPKPHRIGGIVLWDTERVFDAWRRLIEDPMPVEEGLEWGDDPA